MTVLTESRERFLLAIAKQIPVERIAEIHFFTPIKQGGVESGVAVVAAWPESVPEAAAESAADLEAAETVEHAAIAAPPTREMRPVIYTALYRLTLKGMDRGKWETNVVAEADAPLVTVDAVVRGVQRRSGDADDAARMEGDEVRAILSSVTAR